MPAPQKRPQSNPILDYLDAKSGNIMASLPNSAQGAYTWESIKQGIAMTLSKSQALQRCPPQSIYASIIYLIRFGLDPSGQTAEGYLVPRGGVCYPQIGAYGKLALMYRYGGVESHAAEAVYEKDHFKVNTAEGFIEHSPEFFEDRGRFAFAFFRFWKRGSTRPTMVLFSSTDFEKMKAAVKKTNRGKLGPAYGTWDDQMAIRSAISRAWKHVDTGDLAAVLADARMTYESEARGKFVDVEFTSPDVAAIDSKAEPQKALPAPNNIVEMVNEERGEQPDRVVVEATVEEPAMQEPPPPDMDPETGEIVPTPEEVEAQRKQQAAPVGSGTQQGLGMPE